MQLKTHSRPDSRGSATLSLAHGDVNPQIGVGFWGSHSNVEPLFRVPKQGPLENLPYTEANCLAMLETMLESL